MERPCNSGIFGFIMIYIGGHHLSLQLVGLRLSLYYLVLTATILTFLKKGNEILIPLLICACRKHFLVGMNCKCLTVPTISWITFNDYLM